MSILSTAIATSSTTAAAIPPAVVSHDTTTPKLNMINLSNLGVPSSFSVEQQASATLTANISIPLAKLQSLETARFNWETTELAASNKRLYSILKEAYSFYWSMKSEPIKETRALYATGLAKFIEERGYVFTPSSHDMTRVVKCVFGTDRRRVSAYSLALREALRQNVSAENLIAFIEQEGGVEQIRMGGTKPLSATKRAEKVKSEIISTHLGTIKFDPTLFAADADWVDQQVIIVATYQPSGEFQANAVVKHDSAVNAALAAFYSKQQAASRASAKADRENEKVELALAKALEKAANAEEKPGSNELLAAQLAAVAAAREEHASKMAEIHAQFTA